MRLTLPVQTLRSALAAPARVTEARNTIPILSHVRLAASGAGLVVTGSDLDLEARSARPARVSDDGAVCLPAALLADIARKLPADGEVAIDATLKNGRALLRSGRARFELATLPADDFPEAAEHTFTARATVAAGALATALAETAFAISTEETRYYLNGVFFDPIHDADGSRAFRLVATDGHRLARRDLTVDVDLRDAPAIIVPAKMVREIARLAAACDADAPLDLAWSQTRIRVQAREAGEGETPDALASKLIDGTFPDYRRVMPTENPRRWRVDTAELRAALARCAAVLDRSGRAVALTFDGDTLTLASRAEDGGEAEDVIAARRVDGPADPLRIGFNPRYLGDCLDALGDDAVELHLADAGSPTLLVRPDRDDLTIVLMPMRV